MQIPPGALARQFAKQRDRRRASMRHTERVALARAAHWQVDFKAEKRIPDRTPKHAGMETISAADRHSSTHRAVPRMIRTELASPVALYTPRLA